MTLSSVNPTTGVTIATFEPHGPAEVERRLSLATAASRSWRATPVAERARVVSRAGQIVDAEKEQLARIMTLEMGKTLASAVDEAAKCAWGCAFYAEHAEAFLADEAVPLDQDEGYIAYDPLGVVLAVMPWNFPFWQVFRFAAPALCAGNVGLLKHASNVPQCALAIEDIFTRAGAPPGVFQALLVGSDVVEGLIADERVAAVTLTGSERAGSSVAEAAGRHIKKTVLELGGSDPYIVLADADVEQAAATAVRARVINNGQSCIASKRFIAVDAIFEEFTERFVAGMRALRIGDPMDSSTELGPLATRQIRDDLEAQVRATVDAGATVLLEGGTRDGKGWFFAPAVLSDIPDGSPARVDELFGPVASLFRARDADDAVRIANDSRYGLGASIWTRDRDLAHEIAHRMEAGCIAVNTTVRSDLRLPFGGVKMSGYGRELGVVGIREFVNIKGVRVAAGAR